MKRRGFWGAREVGGLAGSHQTEDALCSQPYIHTTSVSPHNSHQLPTHMNGDMRLYTSCTCQSVRSSFWAER
mgnify:CR=1 FL=1